MKAMLEEMNKPVIYSTRPSIDIMTLNEQSMLDMHENQKGGLTQSITSREFFFDKKTRNTVNNTQTGFLTSKM